MSNQFCITCLGLAADFELDLTAVSLDGFTQDVTFADVIRIWPLAEYPSGEYATADSNDNLHTVVIQTNVGEESTILRGVASVITPTGSQCYVHAI